MLVILIIVILCCLKHIQITKDWEFFLGYLRIFLVKFMNFIIFHSEKNFIISGVCLSGVCLSGVCTFKSLSHQEFVFQEFVFPEFVFPEFVFPEFVFQEFVFPEFVMAPRTQHHYPQTPQPALPPSWRFQFYFLLILFIDPKHNNFNFNS